LARVIAEKSPPLCNKKEEAGFYTSNLL